MRLTYSIIWFDDNEDYIDSLDKDEIDKIIKEWGFQPNILYLSDPKKFGSLSPFREFDLLVIDKHIEHSQEGEKFISELRNSNVYTEVIFYSASEIDSLWKSIYEERLQGVYVSDRQSILSKLKEVGYQSLNKILDIENMRGIVMAEVGEIDQTFDEITELAINISSSDELEEFYNDFFDDKRDHLIDQIKSLANFKENKSLGNLVPLCDSNKRWKNFRRLIKKHNEIMSYNLNGDYPKDVLKPRNFLAHGIPKKSATSNDVIFEFQKKQFVYNDSIGKKIRRDLLQYKLEFQKVRNNIKESLDK
ncbi:hypothetical protein JR338_10100 [Chloroflexota bacterium]|nr:hypothetical protein JR338_10100 [Chloroflexota bacterium]